MISMEDIVKLPDSPNCLTSFFSKSRVGILLGEKMGFFKRKDAIVKKEPVESPKKGPISLESSVHERVITATGFTRRALAKARKSK